MIGVASILLVLFALAYTASEIQDLNPESLWALPGDRSWIDAASDNKNTNLVF